MLSRLNFKPGIDVERTPTAQRGGWSTSSLIRWREGLPEVLGGWTHITQQPLVGVCRALHFWVDLTGNARIAAGTNQRLYVQSGIAVPTDITPIGFVPGKISSGATAFSLLIWSLDNFGQNLIAVPSGQGLYAWVPAQVGPAAIVSQAPAVNQGAFVMMPQQIVMAYGCTPLAGGQADPLLARWCDQSDYTIWIAAATNQAGSFRLSRGSRIVGGIQAPNFALLWTDLDVWMVQYIGPPLVFSFTQIGSNCGLISQKAVVVAGGVPYWMSDHGFFQMSGNGATQIPCPVWDIVYKDIDNANSDKCVAAINYHFSEVYFFYPSLSGGTGEIDSYVKLNFLEGEWDYGTTVNGNPSPISRTAWTDQNRPNDPITVDLSGILQQQEQGFTMDNMGAVPASIRSGFQDIQDGTQIMVVSQFIPDFLWGGTNPSLNLTLYFRAFPGDTPTAIGPFKVTPTTEFITLQLPRQLTIDKTNITTWAAPRAREVAVQIDTVSGWWRWGAPRLRTAPAGRI